MNWAAFRKHFIIVFTVLMLSACSLAPGPAEYHFSKKDFIVDTMPVSSDLSEAREFKFLPESLNAALNPASRKTDPAFAFMSLDNHLTAYFWPEQNIPLVTIAAIIKSGEKHDLHRDEIRAPVVLKFLRQGTETYNKQALQKNMAFLGYPVRYFQTTGLTVISAKVLPDDVQLFLHLLAQQLSALYIVETSLKQVIERQLIENRLADSSGQHQAQAFFYQTFYPKAHPYYSVDKESAEFKSLTTTELMAFYRQYYYPGNTILLATGAIQPDQLKHILQTEFKHWKAVDAAVIKNKPKATIPVATSNNDVHIYSLQRKGATQVNILWGKITTEGTGSDWAGLHALAVLLGGGPSSRLFTDLREKQGLTYAIHAQQLRKKFQSPFFIQTSVAYEKLLPMLSGIMSHVDSLCQHSVPPQELHLLKQQITGELSLSLKNKRGWINEMIARIEAGYEKEPVSQIKNDLKQIDALSNAQLLKIAKKWLCGSHQFILVGDRDLLQEQLAGLKNKTSRGIHD
jgi:zinc protease